MRRARLLIDPPAEGSWNMAVDQALLNSADRSGVMTVRIYAWDRPTLSLGYFQKLSERELHAASFTCPVVRRATGGGAIVHDQELTYSLAIPSENRWSIEHEQLYWQVHGCMIGVLEAMGVCASLYQPQTDLDTKTSGKEPSDQSDVHGIRIGDGKELERSGALDPAEAHRFLCFERRSPGDIVMHGYKIGGSAQRRKKHSLLQHGSLLFRRSEFAPELPGIEDWFGVGAFDRSELLGRFVGHLGDQLEVDLIPAELEDREIKWAGQTQVHFRSADWMERINRKLAW